MSVTGKRCNAIFGTVFVGTAVVFVFFLFSQPARAIPAFARKYQTSCATCHSDYPELNDFGEAFKKNGFKFPKDDDSFVKEPPVLLGAPAYKKIFPKAIYPGDIPGSIPIAFRYTGNFNYNSQQPAPLAAAGFTTRTDLFAPNTFTIIAAGTFGQNISFWIDDDISATGSGANGGLGDGYLKFNDLGHYIGLPKNALNVRFGQFELDLPFTQARSIYPSVYDVFSETAVAQPSTTPGQTVFQTANNPFFLGTPQRGIEFGGYANNDNFTWSVAFVDGTNSAYGLDSVLTARNTKDVYVRVSQRFNLERDAQSRKDVQAAGPTGPRDHTSIRFGAFYYHGTNESNFGSSQYSFLGTIQDPFYRAGGDVRFKYRKMELFGVGMVGHDNNQTVDTVAQTIANAPAVNYTGGFAGSNFWIYPWMIAYMRYDFVNSPADFANGVSQYATRNRYSPGFQLLVRANIKLIGEYEHHWGEPYAGPVGMLFFRPNTFVGGIDFAF